MLLTSRLFLRRGPHKTYPSVLQAPLTRPALFIGIPHRAVSTQSSMSAGADQPPRSAPAPTFSVSPVPKNPLGEGRYIRTAAALIIGDEILNGKTHDMNSNYFAKYCFEHGVDLKRIEVIADDEGQIIEASQRMVKNYDFVVTSGGIGPTHDDITYASLAKAFSQSLAHHPETLARMNQMIKHRTWMSTQTPQQRAATERMALFPGRAEVLFVAEDIWVPVVRLEGKLCIFPGIPSLFEKMLTALTPLLPLPPRTERPLRIQVFTERPESMIAPYLTKLQTRLKPHGIQVGSYPVLGQGVFVSLIGRDRPLTTASTTAATQIHENGDEDGANEGKKGRPRISLAEIAREVEQEIGGQVFSEEEVARRKGQCKQLTTPVTIAASMGVQPERTAHMLSNLKAKY
ncbi:MoCF-biosynth domain-containing protein [Mycena venus]|uniref:MoCF-biosynth domain-containing protein n=1 Tax=Mycena venus TaxID=2733690 RepID=A0A8H6YP92_9AGAR|nr:MoCF-biosynth domain-containing protein [Mycena venus]